MRLFASMVLAGIALGQSAHASSFVTLEAMGESANPSVVMIDAGEMAEDMAFSGKPESVEPGLSEIPFYAASGGVEFIEVSPSIIAMADPAPPVSSENVASIEPEDDGEATEGDEGAGLFADLPTVIRGGIVGGAFPAARKASSSPATSPQTAAAGEPARGAPQPNPQDTPSRKPPAAVAPGTRALGAPR